MDDVFKPVIEIVANLPGLVRKRRAMQGPRDGCRQFLPGLRLCVAIHAHALRPSTNGLEIFCGLPASILALVESPFAVRVSLSHYASASIFSRSISSRIAL